VHWLADFSKKFKVFSSSKFILSRITHHVHVVLTLSQSRKHGVSLNSLNVFFDEVITSILFRLQRQRTSKSTRAVAESGLAQAR